MALRGLYLSECIYSRMNMCIYLMRSERNGAFMCTFAYNKYNEHYEHITTECVVIDMCDACVCVCIYSRNLIC